MELRVSFRGKALVVQGVGGATSIADLKEKLADLTAVPIDNQKLILKGKALRGDTDTLEEAGAVVTIATVTPTPGAVAAAAADRDHAGEDQEGDHDQDRDQDQDQDQPRFVQKSRLLMVGSLASEVDGVLKGRAPTVTVRNDFNGGGVAPKGYKRIALNYPAGPPDFSRYRFERIETLPDLPEEDTAREILESLAADPGVRSVLEKHRWTVGALCELYPEGAVGVSGKITLGLNQNHGQKILLRLRTDDLKGFRKILSIRKTLFHELTHNDISEHDDSFYRLMRQVEQEAAELDWRQQSGRTVAGRPPGPRAEPAGLPGNGGGYILVKEAFEGGSGRLGGDSDVLTNMFSATQMAGLAAVQRLTPEEQEIEDCCGHTKGNEETAPAAAAAAAAAAGFPTVTASDGSGSERGAAAAGATPEGSAGGPEEMEEEPEPEPEQGPEQGPEKGQEQGPEQDGRRARGGRGGGGGRAGVDGASAGAVGLSTVSTVSDMEVDTVHDHPAAAVNPATDHPSEARAPSSRPTPTPTPTQAPPSPPPPPPTPPTSTPTVTQTPPVPVPKPPTPPTAPQPSSSSSSPSSWSSSPASASAASAASAGVDTLVTMGFPREAAAQALLETRGSIPDAAYRLLTPGPSNDDPAMAVVAAGDGPTRDQESGGGGGGGGGGGDGVLRLSRDVRVQEAVDRIALYDDRTRAVQCLEVLAGLLRNIMENPEEAKFRRVRRSNGKFKASVGSVPGGVDLLLAAGFEESGADQLQLDRRDPGLIWLARGTVEAWQERLAQEISL